MYAELDKKVRFCCPFTLRQFIKIFLYSDYLQELNVFVLKQTTFFILVSKKFIAEKVRNSRMYTV